MFVHAKALLDTAQRPAVFRTLSKFHNCHLKFPKFPALLNDPNASLMLISPERLPRKSQVFSFVSNQNVLMKVNEGASLKRQKYLTPWTQTAHFIRIRNRI